MVRHLLAVQAQDFYGALWALGLRLPRATADTVEQAFTAGAILRTHLMRPTWHFVAPEDIRWLLALTAPRVHALNALYYRRAGIDSATRRRCRAVLARELGGQCRTREELRVALERAGVRARGALRLPYILMQAELDGLICSGPRRGKQFTYALLEERVRPARPLPRDEALGELARRYFSTRGPATVQDCARWSGLTVADVRRGLAAVQRSFEHHEIRGRTYWFAPGGRPQRSATTAYLLPNYDEYVSSYRFHDVILDAVGNPRLAYPHLLVLNGRLVGTWNRTLGKTRVDIVTHTFAPLAARDRRAVARAARRYGAFVGLPVRLR